MAEYKNPFSGGLRKADNNEPTPAHDSSTGTPAQENESTPTQGTQATTPTSLPFVNPFGHNTGNPASANLTSHQSQDTAKQNQGTGHNQQTQDTTPLRNPWVRNTSTHRESPSQQGDKDNHNPTAPARPLSESRSTGMTNHAPRTENQSRGVTSPFKVPVQKCQPSQQANTSSSAPAHKGTQDTENSSHLTPPQANTHNNNDGKNVPHGVWNTHQASQYEHTMNDRHTGKPYHGTQHDQGPSMPLPNQHAENDHKTQNQPTGKHNAPSMPMPSLPTPTPLHKEPEYDTTWGTGVIPNPSQHGNAKTTTHDDSALPFPDPTRKRHANTKNPQGANNLTHDDYKDVVSSIESQYAPETEDTTNGFDPSWNEYDEGYDPDFYQSFIDPSIGSNRDEPTGLGDFAKYTQVDDADTTEDSHEQNDTNNEPSKVDISALARGVAIGTGRAAFNDVMRSPKNIDAAIARKIQILEWNRKKHIPFNEKVVKAFDYLTRWSYATTGQVARVAGWRDKKESRLVKKLDLYQELGWLTEDVQYAGPRLWYPTNTGAKFTTHPWLGGVNANRVNPLSQSHSIGLSSIASWLLCPWDEVPNFLGLDDDTWRDIRREVKNGETFIVGEREFRSRWASLRYESKGLIDKQYRYHYLGRPEDGIGSAWRDWAEGLKNGYATIEDAPEYMACDPQFMGDEMWMWTIWGNWVWNPERVIQAAAEDGLDVKSMSTEERNEVFIEYRDEGYVNIDDERYDVSTNRPEVRKDMGDRFSLQDHLPDLLIVRKRNEHDGSSRTIALELELRPKSIDDYARSMASFGSTLGKTLYDKVIWLVPNHTVALAIERGAAQVGMVLGEDYDIVPFCTQAKRNSFYSGADILPARFDEHNRVKPIPLSDKILTT